MLQSFDEFVLFSFLIFVNRSCDKCVEKIILHYQFFKFRIIKRFDKGREFSIERKRIIFLVFCICVYMFFISSEIVCTYLLKRFLFIFYLKKDGLSCHKRRKDAKMCGPEIKIILNFVF